MSAASPLAQFDAGGVHVAGDEKSKRRRSAPVDADHVYCDVYLDVFSSYYRTWGEGTSVVSWEPYRFGELITAPMMILGITGRASS